MLSKTRFPVLIFATFVLSWGSGCGSNPELKTVQGLQEQVKVKDSKVTDLEKVQIKLIKIIEEKLPEQQAKEIADLRNFYEEKQKKSQSDIAEISLQLGTERTEKVALREIVDAIPKVKEANVTYIWLERFFWFITCVIFAGFTIVISSKNRERIEGKSQRIINAISSYDRRDQ